jgi:competence protein ComEA
VSRSDRLIIAAVGGALVLAVAAGAVLLMPDAGHASPASNPAALLPGTSLPAASVPPAATAAIVVDVQGAVGQPGVHELPAGSRVADAIEAAGGYATDADLEAATALNLAEPLVDGQQIRVPRIGDGAVAAEAPTDGGAGAGADSGLVNVNTATPEELEALPGIGAVTVQKIVAARQEQPFASLEEMVEREVINRGQLEDITGLATAG